jgi:hypothetical protein
MQGPSISNFSTMQTECASTLVSVVKQLFLHRVAVHVHHQSQPRNATILIRERLGKPVTDAVWKRIKNGLTYHKRGNAPATIRVLPAYYTSSAAKNHVSESLVLFEILTQKNPAKAYDRDTIGRHLPILWGSKKECFDNGVREWQKRQNDPNWECSSAEDVHDFYTQHDLTGTRANEILDSFYKEWFLMNVPATTASEWKQQFNLPRLFERKEMKKERNKKQREQHEAMVRRTMLVKNEEQFHTAAMLARSFLGDTLPYRPTFGQSIAASNNSGFAHMAAQLAVEESNRQRVNLSTIAANVLREMNRINPTASDSKTLLDAALLLEQGNNNRRAIGAAALDLTKHSLGFSRNEEGEK